MSAMPENVVLQIAWGYGPVGPSHVPEEAWVTMTDRLAAWDYQSSGRETFGQGVSAGTLRLLLRNYDGHLSTFNTSSPYYEDLLDRRGTPVRLAAFHDGSWHYVAFAYVYKWDPQLSNSRPVVDVLCADAISLCAQAELPPDYLQYVLRKSEPTVYYRFLETPQINTTTGLPLSATAVDLGPKKLDGKYNNKVTLGSSATYSAGKSSRVVASFQLTGSVRVPRGACPTGDAYTVEMLVQAADTRWEATGERGLWSWDDGHRSVSLYFDRWGRTCARWETPGHTVTATGQDRCFGNQYSKRLEWAQIWLVVNGTTASIWVDGSHEVTVDLTPLGTHHPKKVPMTIGGAPKRVSADATGFFGVMAEFAIYNRALPDPERINHQAARNSTLGANNWMNLALETIGFDHDDVQTGVVSTFDEITAPAWGRTVAEFLDALAETTMSHLYAGPDGKVRMLHRHDVLLQTEPHMVFGDSGDGTEMPYPEAGLVLADEEAILATEVLAQREGGIQQRAANETLISKLGRITHEVRMLDTGSETLPRHRAEFELALRSARTPRVASITVQPWIDGGVWWGPILSLRVGHVVLVRRRPLDGSGSMLEVLCTVEKVQHSAQAGGSWTTKLTFSPTPVGPWWRLGTSRLGVDTKLAY